MRAQVAFETSQRAGSVAVAAGGRALARALDGARSHASDLLPALAALLGELGLCAADIERIAVGTGPGSFTGLRVGIASAQGLARASAAELVGVPSGEVLAFGELELGEQGVLLSDARQGAWYFAHYLRTAKGVQVLAPPRLALRAELALLVPPEAVLFSDAGPELEVACARRLALLPRAEALLELARGRPALAPGELEPLYLRPFAARRAQSPR